MGIKVLWILGALCLIYGYRGLGREERPMDDQIGGASQKIMDKMEIMEGKIEEILELLRKKDEMGRDFSSFLAAEVAGEQDFRNNGEKADAVDEPLREQLRGKIDRVLELYQRGEHIEEISQRTGLEKGEILSILDLIR